MRRSIALLLTGAVLLCGACSNEEPPQPGEIMITQEAPAQTVGAPDDIDMPTGVELDTAPTEFTEQAHLYTVKEAFEKAFAFLGDTEADVNAKLKEDYGLSIISIKHELTGHTNYNVAIAQLLNAAQIPNEAVDWSTNQTYQNLQLPSELVNIPIDIITDRDEFVKYIDTFGITDYLFLASDADRAVGVDFGFMESLLSPEFKPEEHIGSNATFDPNGNFRITRDGSNIPNKSYYTLTTRGNMSYVTYHPTIVDEFGKGLYMKDPSKFTGAPLWQCYFAYYADLIIKQFAIDKKGFVNKTDDGIEIWWGISTGNTVELDVYPTGFVRILLTHDNFLDYNDYKPAVTASGDGETEEPQSAFNDNFTILYNALSAQFDLTIDEWSAIVDMAKELNSPLYLDMASEDVVDSEDIPIWNAFISTYIETIDRYVNKEEVPTVIGYYKAITKLATIGQVDSIKKNIEDLFAGYVERYSLEDESLKTAFVNHTDWIEDFQNLVTGIQMLVGKSTAINLDTSWLQDTPPEVTTVEEEEVTVIEETAPSNW